MVMKLYVVQCKQNGYMADAVLHGARRKENGVAIATEFRAAGCKHNDVIMDMKLYGARCKQNGCMADLELHGSRRKQNEVAIATDLCAAG
jgi:hypothetical protein